MPSQYLGTDCSAFRQEPKIDKNSILGSDQAKLRRTGVLPRREGHGPPSVCRVIRKLWHHLGTALDILSRLASRGWQGEATLAIEYREWVINRH